MLRADAFASVGRSKNLIVFKTNYSEKCQITLDQLIFKLNAIEWHAVYIIA